MRKNKLQLEELAPGEWCFARLPGVERYDGLLDEAIELMRSGADAQAEALLQDIIEEFPLHIDAYHHLAMLLDEQGQAEQAFRLWKQAVQIGMQAFPEGFVEGDNWLIWAWLENRPFLRAYNGLALAYYERGEAETAARMFENLLTWNPNDNQGVRALAIVAYLALGRPEKALEVTERYSEDILVDVLYGRALAQFQLGRRQEADASLQVAIDQYPLVAKELVKGWHKPPKGMYADRVTVGGTDEAYAYWEYVGRYWRETPGALDWVREKLAARQVRDS